MKVGRSPIDEDAIRLLEQHNPDIQFDWPRILKPPPPGPPIQKEERRSRDRRPERPPVSGPGMPPRPARPPQDVHPAEPPEPVDVELAGDPATSSAEDAQMDAEPESVTGDSEYETSDVAASTEAESGPPFEPDLVEPERAGLSGPVESVDSAAFSRLGPEVLARLRARYAEIMARIAERPLEEDAREQLKQRAERLNPDGWVTADEVAQALEVYENVYDGIRAVVGHPHRRRKRGRKGRGDGQDGQV